MAKKSVTRFLGIADTFHFETRVFGSFPALLLISIYIFRAVGKLQPKVSQLHEYIIRILKSTVIKRKNLDLLFLW